MVISNLLVTELTITPEDSTHTLAIALIFSSTGSGNNHSISISTENYNNVSYLLPTALYVKPSSYALHRPFDGGVEINHDHFYDSSVVEQTRRYFRYQSGKGLQYSTATNFNPPIGKIFGWWN